MNLFENTVKYSDLPYKHQYILKHIRPSVIEELVKGVWRDVGLSSALVPSGVYRIKTPPTYSFYPVEFIYGSWVPTSGESVSPIGTIWRIGEEFYFYSEGSTYRAEKDGDGFIWDTVKITLASSVILNRFGAPVAFVVRNV